MTKLATLDKKKLRQIQGDVERELESASAKNERFNSAHEGWGVLYEEVDELWDEIRKKRALRSEVEMRAECVQIAAMAMRFIHDLL